MDYVDCFILVVIEYENHFDDAIAGPTAFDSIFFVPARARTPRTQLAPNDRLDLCYPATVLGRLLQVPVVPSKSAAHADYYISNVCAVNITRAK
ncbi:MAG TPA: hypothetical protein VIM11_09025 [Tepidisphaeraceae bacterium]|jgi:hypothetical protein